MNIEMLSIVHSDEKWDLSEQFIYNWRIIRVWFSAERFGHSSPAIWSRVRQAEQTARAYLPFPGSQTFTYAHVYTRLHAQTCATIRISLSPQNDSTIYIGAIKPEKRPKTAPETLLCFIDIPGNNVAELKLLACRSWLKENDAVKWNCHL